MKNLSRFQNPDLKKCIFTCELIATNPIGKCVKKHVAFSFLKKTSHSVVCQKKSKNIIDKIKLMFFTFLCKLSINFFYLKLETCNFLICVEISGVQSGLVKFDFHEFLKKEC